MLCDDCANLGFPGRAERRAADIGSVPVALPLRGGLAERCWLRSRCLLRGKKQRRRGLRGELRTSIGATARPTVRLGSVADGQEEYAEVRRARVAHSPVLHWSGLDCRPNNRASLRWDPRKNPTRARQAIGPL